MARDSDVRRQGLNTASTKGVRFRCSVHLMGRRYDQTRIQTPAKGNHQPGSSRKAGAYGLLQQRYELLCYTGSILLCLKGNLSIAKGRLHLEDARGKA